MIQQPAIVVQFSAELHKTQLDQEAYRQLIRDSFGERTDIEQVVVSELPGGQVGMGSLAILLAQPIGKDGVEHNPLIVRVGRPDRIAAELSNYQRYIAPHTGPNLVQPRGSATIGALACITYDYLDEVRSRQPLHTLRDYLWRDFDLDAATRAIEILFLDTLGRGNQKNCWYNDAHTFPDQCPLWFYNQVLPPTLTLDQVTVGGKPDAYPALTDLLPRADQPNATDLHGRMVALATNTAYPHLRMVKHDRAAGYLTLYLLTGLRNEDNSYLPLLPVAARIDVYGDPDRLARLSENLDETVFHGRICGTRYAALSQRYRRLGSLLKMHSDGCITYDDILWKNPLQHYYRLLTQQRPLRTSIIHGDMNLGNILLNRPEKGRSADAIAWLIDFDRVTPGGHTVFDAVKLETEYKIHILPHRLHAVEDFIRLEKALNQSLINPESSPNFEQHYELYNAYQFIATLRRIALRQLAPGGEKIPPTEYFLGLLGYGMAALKYDNLYDDQSEGWLSPMPCVTPLAAAAYLSAASAVFAIETYEGRAIHENSFRPAQSVPTAQPLIPRPRLCGRDAILSQAYKQIDTGPPVVQLCGRPGSGRGDVARAIYAELQRSNYTVWKPGLTQTFTTVDDLFEELAEYLHSRRISEPEPAPTSPLSKSRSTGGRKTKLLHMRQHLFEALESSPTRFLICVRCDLAKPEFREFVARLCNGLRHSAAIVIADRRLEHLDEGVVIDVSPLSLEAVRDYVRYEQLSLDERAIKRLHSVSFGMPAILTLIVSEAAEQHGVSLQDAVMSMQEYKKSHDFAREVVQKRLPEPFLRILELDALLAEYSPIIWNDVELLFVRLARMLTWTTAKELPAVQEWYREHKQTSGGLVALLRQPALNSLRARDEFRTLCAQIADFYAAQQTPSRMGIVACYHALAEKWIQAADILVDIAKDPAQIYTSGCQTIYTATKEVLQHGSNPHEETLLELAGDCAAYLGDYQSAAEHYERLLFRLRLDNPRFLRLNVQLLKVHEAYGDRDEAQKVYQVLHRHARQSTNPSNPIYALGLAYRGVALLDTDLSQAEEALEAAIQILEQTRDQWASEQRFYEEELARLNDYLSRAQAFQGKYDRAIETLKRTREMIGPTNEWSKALIAMIDNDLGAWYFYRGLDNDISLAHQSFQAAFDERKRLGDRVGQMRTAQNLAILTVELAKTLDDWRKAEQQYAEFELVARSVGAADRALLMANHMEVLIRAGDFKQAHAQFEAAMRVPNLGKDTRILLLTNRAKLGLWEGNKEECEEYLGQVLALVNTRDDIINQLEWLQLTLESHIVLKIPYVHSFVQQLAGSIIPDDERPVDAAAWSLACGLLAFIQGDHTRALVLVERSRALWITIEYSYLGAIAALWKMHVQIEIGDTHGAQTSAISIENILRPFGTTPALERLYRLQQHIAKEI